MIEKATGGKRLNIGYGGPRRPNSGEGAGKPKKKRYFTGHGK